VDRARHHPFAFAALLVAILINRLPLPGPVLGNDDVAFWFMEDSRFATAIIARHRAGVPVIENEDADKAARTVADLVLDAAEQSRTVAR